MLLSQKYNKLVGLAVLILGLILRVKVYLENRNLFLDEVSVALNLCERPWTELFHSLDYQQHFPPFLLVMIKWITQVFGINDLSLRFIPFMMGLLALTGFYWLLKNRVKIPWFSILIFASSVFILRYQTEFKQYSGDILASVVFLALLYKFESNRKKYNLVLFGFCILAPWFSMPSIFLISSLLIYLFLTKTLRYFRLIFLGLASVLSFLSLYFISLKPSLSSNHLLNFHSNYFIQLPLSAWGNNLSILENFIGAWLGSTAFTVGSVVILLFAGFNRLRIQSFHKALAILSVFILTILASLLQQYSMIPRLLCFWIPLVLWVMAFGAEFILEFLLTKGVKPLLVSALFLGLFLFPNVFYKHGLVHFWQALQTEQSRELLQDIKKEILPGDEIWLTQYGTPAFRYYSGCHAHPVVLENKVQYFDHPQFSNQILDKLKSKEISNRIWIVDTHKTNSFESTLINNYPNNTILRTKECFAILIQ